MIKPNIALLAGGQGTRLWPLSNQNCPKQFIRLPSFNLSSFQLTLKRSLVITTKENIIITINHQYLNLLEQQIVELGLLIADFQIILEELILNTGMAIYDICYFLLEKDNNQLTYFFPTDHILDTDPNIFSSSLTNIDVNRINLFGQLALTSCNKFGYIIVDQMLSEKYYNIKEFIEKPTQSLHTEKLYRNLGIYLAKPSILYVEFKRLYLNLSYKLNLSIDKMIAEKSPLLNLIEIDFDWSDIGSISSLHQLVGQYQFNNIEINQDDILSFNNTHSAFKLEYNNKTLFIKELSHSPHDISKIGRS